ncbi:MAG TPA: hypothetical protein VGE74_15325 [Gemmata sp.]
MTEPAAEFEPFLNLVRHWHTGHPRTDQVQHCQRVWDWLRQALDREPAPVPARRELLLAALGHDLYEDSAIPRAQVATEYGADVDRLIEAVTERDGVAEFVERVAGGSEGARLVKLADGIDNYDSLVRTGLLRADPAKWADVVRKQMEPMFSRIGGMPFHQYPTAGRWLAEQLDRHRERFWAELTSTLRGLAPASET